MRLVSFLNVTVNLANKTFRDFSKPNHVPLYVHKESNHPPAVTKCIAKGVGQRLSANSSSLEQFNNAKGLYQEQLLKETDFVLLAQFLTKLPENMDSEALFARIDGITLGQVHHAA